jgi:hypothetical protein
LKEPSSFEKSGLLNEEPRGALRSKLKQEQGENDEVSRE